MSKHKKHRQRGRQGDHQPFWERSDRQQRFPEENGNPERRYSAGSRSQPGRYREEQSPWQGGDRGAPEQWRGQGYLPSEEEWQGGQGQSEQRWQEQDRPLRQNDYGYGGQLRGSGQNSPGSYSQGSYGGGMSGGTLDEGRYQSSPGRSDRPTEEYGGSSGYGSHAFGGSGQDQGYGQQRSGQQGQSTQRSSSQRIPKAYQRTDERIREDIYENLMNSDELDASDVSVQVKDGKVTLEGTVPERFMKHEVEDTWRIIARA